jgi:hypothetical protein
MTQADLGIKKRDTNSKLTGAKGVGGVVEVV